MPVVRLQRRRRGDDAEDRRDHDQPITHTEAGYIDATGDERLLFLWPFYPWDVKRVLSKVA